MLQRGGQEQATAQLERTRSALITELQRRGYSLATAESCTMGAVAATVGAPAGASAWLRGGLIVYQSDLKVQLLGIPAAFIDEHHVVSEAVARAMAQSVAQRLGAELGLGITGLAGPGGADAEHPVGMICIAAYLEQGDASHWLSQTYHFAGDRAQNIAQAIEAALALGYRLLSRSPEELPGQDTLPYSKE